MNSNIIMIWYYNMLTVMEIEGPWLFNVLIDYLYIPVCSLTIGFEV